MCILLTEGGSLSDFEGIQLLTRPQTPHIVIPTTAGTGSEVTWAAVIYDKSKGQKILIVNPSTPRVWLFLIPLNRETAATLNSFYWNGCLLPRC